MEPSPRRGAIVLAGGKSTRMGRDKAWLPFGEAGGTMLSRVVSVLSRTVSEIVIVARQGQPLPDVSRAAGTASVTRVDDEVEGRGPVGGLVPGLRALSAPVAFASACDVPFLSEALVRSMFEALGDADVAIPDAEGFLHPLGAVYRRSVLPHLETLLAEDRLRPIFLLERVPHVTVSEAQLRLVDPDLSSLANVNSPEAYEAALVRARRERGPPG